MIKVNKDEPVIEKTIELEEVTEQLVPIVLSMLIDLSHRMLSEYQEKLYDDIGVAASDLMKTLGMSPSEGWRLDMVNKKFIKQ